MNLFLFQLKCDILISKIKRKKKEDFDLANKKLKILSEKIPLELSVLGKLKDCIIVSYIN